MNGSWVHLPVIFRVKRKQMTSQKERAFSLSCSQPFSCNHTINFSLSQWTLKKKTWTLFSLLNMEPPKVQKVSHWLSKFKKRLCRFFSPWASPPLSTWDPHLPSQPTMLSDLTLKVTTVKVVEGATTESGQKSRGFKDDGDRINGDRINGLFHVYVKWGIFEFGWNNPLNHWS